ncbi:MAG: S41 family peptidase [Chloroflexi bacterium]|nr:MAG: S41 family peptidase [Chloroflexota bacterium]
MESKPVRIIVALIIAVFLMLVSFAGGIFAGINLPSNISLPSNFSPQTTIEAQATPSVTNTPVDRETLFKPFWQAWDLVHKQYVDQPVDDTTLMRGAISGMLNSLGDPNTAYMDPDQYQQANAPLEGSYEGIGAWVDTTGEFLTVISPMAGSPAEAAGLKSGDMIIAVDGTSAVGTDPTLVLRNVLGPAGSTVVLTIQREGEENPFDVSIVREEIVIPLVTSKMLDNNIAYLQVIQFGDRTEREVKDALKKLLNNDPQGLILDLRNDPGGYLDTAIAVVSQFISDGVVMYEDHGNGERVTFTARSGGLATEIPLVVLVNEGSASASEITAGAIQDRNRGMLVGTTTYGKGTVQSWSTLVDNQGAIKVTIAHWLTPNERQIHGIGLTPDVEVQMTEEDIKANRDPQLDKAVEILLSGQN